MTTDLSNVTSGDLINALTIRHNAIAETRREAFLKYQAVRAEHRWCPPRCTCERAVARRKWYDTYSSDEARYFPGRGEQHGPSAEDLKRAQLDSLDREMVDTLREAGALESSVSAEVGLWKLASFEELTGDNTAEFDGRSRYDDLMKNVSLDDRAVNFATGSLLKLEAARAFNRSTWLGSSDGNHVEIRLDGSWFKRPLTDVGGRFSSERGDLHQRHEGELAISAVVFPEQHDANKEPTGSLGVWAVEAIKHHLPTTADGWQLWASVMGKKRTFRQGAWFYHPLRGIRIGTFDPEKPGQQMELTDDAMLTAYRWHREIESIESFPTTNPMWAGVMSDHEPVYHGHGPRLTSRRTGERQPDRKAQTDDILERQEAEWVDWDLAHWADVANSMESDDFLD